jgi:hypothetical protein
MAYKKQVQGRSYPHLYNVTMTVGSRKSVSRKVLKGDYDGMVVTTYQASFEPNKRDDVMLVQYLLKRVYQQGQNCNPPLQANGTTSLKIDGMYGPKTQGAIEKFQLEMRRNGRSIATDGCVDSELGDSATSSISKTGYTISWLNKYFWVLYPNLAHDISVDPECPAELKQAVGGGLL